MVDKMSFGKLLHAVADEVQVADVLEITSDQGTMWDVILWCYGADPAGDVLQIVVQLPDEVLEKYDFGDFTISDGLKRLSEHLRKRKGDDGS